MRALRGLRAPKLKGANIIKQIGAKIRDPIGIKARRQEKIALADNRLSRARIAAQAHDPAVKTANIAVKNARDALADKQKNAKTSQAGEAAVGTKCQQRIDTRLGKRTRWQNFWGGLGRFTKDEATDARLDRMQAEQDALDKERAMDIAEAEAFLATADPADRDEAQDALTKALTAPRKTAALVHAPGPAIGKGFWAYPATVLWNRSVIEDDARFKDSAERLAAAQTRIARAEITKARAALNEAQRVEMLRISSSEEAQREVANAQTVRNALDRTWMDGLKDRGAQLVSGLQKIPGAESATNALKWYATKTHPLTRVAIGAALAASVTAVAMASVPAAGVAALVAGARGLLGLSYSKKLSSGINAAFERWTPGKNNILRAMTQTGAGMGAGVGISFGINWLLSGSLVSSLNNVLGDSDTPPPTSVKASSTTSPSSPAAPELPGTGRVAPAEVPEEIKRAREGGIQAAPPAPPDVPADAAAPTPAPEAARPAVSRGIQTGDPETMIPQREAPRIDATPHSVPPVVDEAPPTRLAAYDTEGDAEARIAHAGRLSELEAERAAVDMTERPAPVRTPGHGINVEAEAKAFKETQNWAEEAPREAEAVARLGRDEELRQTLKDYETTRRQKAAWDEAGSYERPEDVAARAAAAERYAIEQHENDQAAAAQAASERTALEQHERDQSTAAVDREATVRAYAVEDQRLARETAEAFKNQGVHGAFRTMMEDPNSSITHAASEAGINFEGNNKEGLSEALNRTLAKHPKFMSYFDTSDHTASIRTEGGKFMSKVDIDPSDPKSGEIVRGMFKNLSSDKAFMAEFEKTLQSGTYDILRRNLGGSEKISALIRSLQQ